MLEYIPVVGLASLWTLQPYILKYVTHVDPIITWMFTLIFAAIVSIIIYLMFPSKNNIFDVHHIDYIVIFIFD